MEDVDIFKSILSTLRSKDIYHIWPFGTFCADLVYFFRFGIPGASL
jgi:hypothetical protein